jgi:hypothetical protein
MLRDATDHLGTAYRDDYGVALIIAPGARQLTDLVPKPSTKGRDKTRQVLDFLVGFSPNRRDIRH